MELGLAGRVALVTGASRGLGRAIASALRAEGCRVVINARDREPLARAAEEIGGDTLAVAGDVTDPAACRGIVERTVRECGALDVLVCNVGSGRSVAPGEETAAEWRRVLDLNLLGATSMVEAAAGPLAAGAARRGGAPGDEGAIVCISSICGLEALGAPVTYSAAKAALNAFVRGAARPLGRKGVRINAVAPGNLLFLGSVWERKLADDRAAVEAMLDRDVALGRLGGPAEVAGLVAYLASPRAAFATGAVYVMDGGQLRS